MSMLDGLFGATRTVYTGASDLATLAAFTGVYDGQLASVKCHSVQGDDGGGDFYWDSSSSTTANDGTVLGTGAAGRWKRVYSGAANVRWFGAKGDGVTNDYAAFVAALAASKNVFVPDHTTTGYLIGTAKITIPADTWIRGAGIRSTKLLHGWNGDMFEMSDGAGLEHLHIAGQGATYTGKALKFSSTAGRQKVNHCRIIDFADYCMDFGVSAGSQSSFLDVEMYQTNGRDAGKWAVNIEDAVMLTAVPRKFTHIETSGMRFISFGGSNDTHINGGYVGETAWSANSRGVLITGTRLAGADAALTVRGANNAIVGCDVAPAITIASGADQCHIGPNSYNLAPFVTDSSGNNRCQVFTHGQAYTPTWAASGTPVSLGNGTITGYWSRNGTVVTFSINLTMGGTTTYGTGVYTFTLPPPLAITTNQTVECLVYDSSANLYYSCPTIIGASVATCSPLVAGTGQMSPTSPITFASGDVIRISGSYQI